MQVKLKNISGKAEELIIDCARVSNPSNQGNYETAPRLINYLIKHMHWSPFEMAHMTLEITTSRAIAAQILRHKSFSFQEKSQRYSSDIEFEPMEIRKQAEKNRQSSTESFDPELINYCWDSNLYASDIINAHLRKTKMLYESLIKEGVAKECARMILPLCTSTTLYMTGNIRSWIHYIDLRKKEDTQKEHRLIAEACKKIFVENLPNISAALDYSN